MVSWYRIILFCQYFSLVWNHCGDLRSHGLVWTWDSSSLIFHIFVLRLQWAKKLGWLFLAVGGRSSTLEWQLTATLGEVRRHCVETCRPRSTRRYAWWSGVLQAVVTNYHRVLCNIDQYCTACRLQQLFVPIILFMSFVQQQRLDFLWICQNLPRSAVICVYCISRS